MYRIGNGYDVHRLQKGEMLRLAGIDIPSEYEILAHSDGDIVLHALMDAILGALGEDDIGKHFPDNDARYKGADSGMLLREVLKIMDHKGYRIVNVDLSIVLEKPKLRPHIPKMKASLASLLAVEEERVNIKASTAEKMGFVGSSEGIECYSVSLLSRK